MLTLLIILQMTYILSASNDDVLFTGDEFISTPMISNPLHKQKNELGIIFRTTLSSCLLFYASGVSGDYIALELIRGRIRLVANSDGIESINKPAIDLIHGTNYDNYADGNYHQVNIEIGEYTKIYTYTYPIGKSNDTISYSTAKDLRYDLDEVSYYLGIPISERVHTKNILMSNKNFKGCLNSISFNKEQMRLTPLFFQNSKNVMFHGKLNHNCDIVLPKYLKSFTHDNDYLNIFSHSNKNIFRLKFSYRTYLQTGIIFKSLSTLKKQSSIILSLKDNALTLKVNISDTLKLQFSHFDSFADDGTWKEVHVEIRSKYILFEVNGHKYSYDFDVGIKLSFGYLITFGGKYGNVNGFHGCIKDIYVGKNLKLVNEILQLDAAVKYEEKTCKMVDLCFPTNPCQNKGRCIQNSNKVACNCTNTGFQGDRCHVKDDVTLMESCDEYFQAGYRKSGNYIIKPGTSFPFKVRCEMNETLGGPKTIVDTNLKNYTYAFTGKDFDRDYYYYYVSYKATKNQILDLIKKSTHCQQYIRYNCYESVLLNTKDKSHLTELGVRWYSREGFKKNTWHSNESNKPICQCADKENCVQSNLQCNCDVMDKNLRYDDGYITEQSDLPISKIRISILQTNHRSAFHVGPLVCNSQNKINDANKAKNVILNTNDLTNQNVSFNGFNNETSIQKNKPPENILIIDRKLLYVIIASIVLFIVLFLLLLIFKRYLICCCCDSYKNHPKPQIIEIYKDELLSHQNNNRDLESNDLDLSEMNRPLARDEPSNSNSSSVSTIDPNRYFSPPDSSDDNQSIQSNKSNNSLPPKSILKIKKETKPILTKQQKQQQEMLAQLQKQQQCFEQVHHPQILQTPCKLKPQQSDENSPENSNKKLYHEIDSHNCSIELPNETHKLLENNTSLSNDSIEQQVIYFTNFQKESTPLKQKILQLSTQQKTEIKQNNNKKRSKSSSSSFSSISLTSSKESSSDDDDGMTCHNDDERKPLHKLTRSKSVRFTDDDAHSITYIKSKSMDEETILFLYNNMENAKTLV